MFNELINKITVDIKTKEGRSRSMPTNENIAFKHAVTHLLKDLWKAFKSIPVNPEELIKDFMLDIEKGIILGTKK